MNRFRRWLVMTTLCLSGGIIFLLPYLFEVYYIPLREALGLSRTQLGSLMSAFGITALITYFPGGWLADRISPRKLISTSCISTSVNPASVSMRRAVCSPQQVPRPAPPPASETVMQCIALTV